MWQHLITILTVSAVIAWGAPLNSKLSKHPVFIVVSYDGFRSDYFDRSEVTPWLNALRQSGVSVPYMEPAFPTKTFPNHMSIATGLYTESHGIVDNTVWDPLYNLTLSGFNDDPGFWNYSPDVLPLWIRNELAGDGRVSGCLMWPGSSIAYGVNSDLLPTYYYPGYDGSVPWESRVDTVISWITNDTKPANLVYMYYDEPDTQGHAYGPNSNNTLAQVEKADNRTAYLVNKLIQAGIYESVNLILLSDHGMAAVTNQRIIYLDSLVQQDLIEAKHGGTPLLRFTPKPGKKEELYDNLKSLTAGRNFSVWKKEELREPFYYGEGRRITDLMVVADTGYAFDDFNKTIDYYNGKYNLTADETTEYGVHGYTNQVTDMRPFFIASGPAFKRSYEHTAFKNVDIVPLISAVLQLQDVPTNGSLSRVVDMINPSFLQNVASSPTAEQPSSASVIQQKGNAGLTILE